MFNSKALQDSIEFVRMRIKNAAPTYGGMATGVTPNPIAAIKPQMNPQAIQAQQQASGGSKKQQDMMQMPVMPSTPTLDGITAQQAQRGFNNTPIKQTSGTPGAPGRPPTRKKM